MVFFRNSQDRQEELITELEGRRGRTLESVATRAFQSLAGENPKRVRDRAKEEFKEIKGEGEEEVAGRCKRIT